MSFSSVLTCSVFGRAAAPWSCESHQRPAIPASTVREADLHTPQIRTQMSICSFHTDSKLILCPMLSSIRQRSRKHIACRYSQRCAPSLAINIAPFSAKQRSLSTVVLWVYTCTETLVPRSRQHARSALVHGLDDSFGQHHDDSTATFVGGRQPGQSSCQIE